MRYDLLHGTTTAVRERWLMLEEKKLLLRQYMGPPPQRPRYSTVKYLYYSTEYHSSCHVSTLAVCTGGVGNVMHLTY